MPSYSMTDADDRIDDCELMVSNWNTAVPPMYVPRIKLSADQNRPDGLLPGPPRSGMALTIF